MEDGRNRGDSVYALLKERILGHEFLMGTPLREDEVASWFGASRVPAREALRRLGQEGLVERVGRKYAVRSYSYAEIVVTYRQRAALEHLAVEQMAALRQPEALARVESILEAQRRAVEGPVARGPFSRLDRAFHLAIAEATGIAMLITEIELILNRVELIRSNEVAFDSGPVGAWRDHCRIFDALRRGDAASAKAELNYHYDTTLRFHVNAQQPFPAIPLDLPR